MYRLGCVGSAVMLGVTIDLTGCSGGGGSPLKDGAVIVPGIREDGNRPSEVHGFPCFDSEFVVLEVVTVALSEGGRAVVAGKGGKLLASSRFSKCAMSSNAF